MINFDFKKDLYHFWNNTAKKSKWPQVCTHTKFDKMYDEKKIFNDESRWRTQISEPNLMSLSVKLDKIREENRNLQNEIVSLTYKNKELHKEIQKLKLKQKE